MNNEERTVFASRNEAGLWLGSLALLIFGYVGALALSFPRDGRALRIGFWAAFALGALIRLALETRIRRREHLPLFQSYRSRYDAGFLRMAWRTLRVTTPSNESTTP